MPQRFVTPLWAITHPESWTVRTGEDGPTFQNTAGSGSFTVHAAQLRSGKEGSLPGREATLEQWRACARGQGWNIPDTVHRVFGDWDGIRQAQSARESLQVIWYLRAGPVPRQRPLTLIIFEHGPLRPARQATAHQQAMELMLGTLEAYPNRR